MAGARVHGDSRISPRICDYGGISGASMHSLGLEYHDVSAGDQFDSSGFSGAASASYKLSERDFAAHLDAIRATGAHVWRSDRMASVDPHATQVFLTFDDGGRAALKQTAPL